MSFDYDWPSDELLNFSDTLKKEFDNDYLQYLVTGFPSKLTKAAIPLQNIFDDERYVTTCMDFIVVITQYAQTGYPEKLTRSRNPLNPDVLREYNYFDRPEQWQGHNPICNSLLDDFTLKYLEAPEYQNNRLSLEILKAYTASAVYDDMFMQLNKTQTGIANFPLFLFSNSLVKYQISQYILRKLGFFIEWFFIPLLALILFEYVNKTLGVIVTGLFVMHLFSRLMNILDTAAWKFQRAKGTQHALQRISNTVYINEVLSQKVISIDSLRSLIKLHENGYGGMVGSYPAPAHMLIDALEQTHGKYIHRD
jgi:hypothetical protein